MNTPFLPIHYRGPVPVQNQTTAAFVHANSLDALRDKYTAEWIATINPETRALLTAHNIAEWAAVRNDTTPYYRTGSRYSDI